MKPAPPLRFLVLVVGGWLLVRAAMLAPGWWRAPADMRAGQPAGRPTATVSAADPAMVSVPPAGPAMAMANVAPAAASHDSGGRPLLKTPPAFVSPVATAFASPALAPASGLQPAASPAHVLQPPASPAMATPAPGPGRWAGSAWMMVRDERGAAGLAPGGTLGGSQAGARLAYRIADGLALSLRVYAPLRRPRGAEAAAGLDWRPSARLPIHLLAERRQDLGGAGRSAFALGAYGGFSRALRGLRLDAYAQAGIVGIRARDLFADGALKVLAPIGPVELGAGAWGGAQPGAARLDAGPSLSWRLPVRRANLRLSADWRFRLAGDAAPGSGPALTLAADF